MFSTHCEEFQWRKGIQFSINWYVLKYVNEEEVGNQWILFRSV